MLRTKFYSVKLSIAPTNIVPLFFLVSAVLIPLFFSLVLLFFLGEQGTGTTANITHYIFNRSNAITIEKLFIDAEKSHKRTPYKLIIEE